MTFVHSTTEQTKTSAQPHHKYRAIIWDLGGVLIQFNHQKILLDIFGAQENIPSFMHDIHKEVHWRNWDRGAITLDELCNAVAGADAPQKDKEHVADFVQRAHNGLVLLEAGCALLLAAKKKGYKNFVLSNLTGSGHEKIKNIPDFWHHFDGTVFSYQAKLAKPEPEMYTHLLETYGLDPQHCLFIDDLDQNIEGGKAVGIDGVVCRNHTQLFDDLKELGVLD